MTAIRWSGAQPLGALVLGFGVTAWSSAVGLGRTIEGLQAHLDVSSDWTEASARGVLRVVVDRDWVGGRRRVDVGRSGRVAGDVSDPEAGLVDATRRGLSRLDRA